MPSTTILSPASVRDALDAIALGADPVRLAEVCTAQAATTPEPGRGRLERAAEAMRRAAELVAGGQGAP